MNFKKIGILSEFSEDVFRTSLKKYLSKELGISISDINSIGHPSIQIQIEYAAQLINDKKLDIVLLVSKSGNTFQILANKIDGIRAAVLPHQLFIDEVINLNANMIEIDTATKSFDEAKDVFINVLKKVMI